MKPAPCFACAGSGERKYRVDGRVHWEECLLCDGLGWRAVDGRKCCVIFDLLMSGERVQEIEELLLRVGSQVLVVGDEQMIRAHVHTDDAPGALRRLGQRADVCVRELCNP